MDKILAIATKVASPLALGGLIVGVFFLILRQIISAGLIPQVTPETGGEILLRIINGFLVLALVATVLGFLGYVIRMRYPQLDPNYVNIGTGGDLTLTQIVNAVAKARNVTISFSPNCKNSVRSAIIEGESHEGRNIEEFLENLKQRVKGTSINYVVKKEGAKRYEIVCK